MLDATLHETLELLKQAQAQAMDPLAKATFNQPGTATTGLQTYNLEIGAKNLYPILSPLRNMIPRVGGQTSIQANWRAVTGVNTANMFAGVAEGRRGGIISVGTAEYFAAFRTIGLEANATFEAELSSAGFDDVRARAAKSSLESLMEAEERLILAGSTSYSLNGGSAAPTPTLTSATSGGSLAQNTEFGVAVVPLTYEGKARATVAGGVVQSITVNPAEGGTAVTVNGGTGRKSATATITTANSGGSVHSITATVTTSGVAGVRGAYAYAWFWGATGSERLGAITTTNRVVITAAAAGTQTLASITDTDNSKNDLVFDGLLTFAANAANNGYHFAAAPGAGLTADSAGGILEIDAALRHFWDNYRLSPTRIIIGSQEMSAIRKKILAQPSAAAARFTFNVQQGQLVGGGMAKGYLNPYSTGGGPAEIPFMLHPFMPQGTMLFICESLPYPLANVTNVMQILTRRDYYQIEWPLRSRQYEYGVYSDQVLQHYFMPSLGVITNLSDA